MYLLIGETASDAQRHGGRTDANVAVGGERRSSRHGVSPAQLVAIAVNVFQAGMA